MKKLKELFEIIIAWLTAYINGEGIKKLQANKQTAQQQALQPVKLQVRQDQKFDPLSGIMLLEDYQANSIVAQRINQINHDPVLYPVLCHEVVKGGILNYFHIIADDLYSDIGRLLLNITYEENKYLSSRNDDYIPMNTTATSVIVPQKYRFSINGLHLYYDLGKMNLEQRQYFLVFWQKATATQYYAELRLKYCYLGLKPSLKGTILSIKIM